MLKVGIFGASGFVGEELAKILFEGEFDTDCNNFSIKKAAQLCELAFLALPHTVSMNFVPALLKKTNLVANPGCYPTAAISAIARRF